MCILNLKGFHLFLASLALLAFAGGLLPTILYQQAYADGLFQENLPPAKIGDRQASLFVKINPPILTSDTKQDAYMQFRLFDQRNNETIKFTTFIISVTKGTDPAAKPLLPPDAYLAENGLLTLKMQPKEGAISVAATREDYLQAWKADPGGTINIRGPVLSESGLYHFRIELLTIDNIHRLFLPGDSPVYETYLSVGDVSSQSVEFGNKSYPVTIISYYDKLKDFAFDAKTKTYSWAMPFDWNVIRIEKAANFFVHEEVRMPKTFAGVGDAYAYDATVNGRPIGGRMLQVDPFSSETEQIVHFLLNRNDILDMARSKPSGQEMTFAFSPASNSTIRTSGEIATDTGGIHVILNWSPSQLHANTDATVHMQFVDAFAGANLTDDVKYDMKILDKDGNVIVSRANQLAEGGNADQTMKFPADEDYRVEITVKELSKQGQTPDLTRNGIARGTVVAPEFPYSVLAASLSVALAVAFLRTRAWSAKT
jgi:hypothetical protein